MLYQNPTPPDWFEESNITGIIKQTLNKTIEEEDNFYDAVMCVGTFTFGHVKPPALDEFIRVTKNRGLICFTINEGIHEEMSFKRLLIIVIEKN